MSKLREPDAKELQRILKGETFEDHQDSEWGRDDHEGAARSKKKVAH